MKFLQELFFKILRHGVSVVVILGLIGLLIDSIKYIFNFESKNISFRNNTSFDKDFNRIFNNWRKDFDDDNLEISFKSDSITTSYTINSKGYDINISIKIKSKY